MIDSQADQNGRLMVVLAHPDDETFGTGGTIALHAARGAAVHLVCATRGEVGEMDPGLMHGYSSVGEVRAMELRCASQMLGIQTVTFMDYRDSGMPGSADNSHPLALVAQNLESVAAKIVFHIRKIKPHVIVTFDPIGGYRHPDHIAIHRATVLAFKLAADEGYTDVEAQSAWQPNRLMFHTVSRGFLKAGILFLRLIGKDPSKFGKNGDIDLVSLVAEEFPTHAEIDFTSVRGTVEKAAACHESQGGRQMNSGIQKAFNHLFRARETFMQAYPAQPPRKPLRDLFEGIDLQT